MNNIYVIGGELEGAERISSLNREISGDTVIVIEDSSISTYQCVLKAILYKNRVIVIVDDIDSIVSKSVAAILACNKQYDIYGKDEIIGADTNWLIDNHNTLQDIKAFIGASFTDLNEVSDMLKSVEDSISEMAENNIKNNQILSVVAYILEYLWGEVNDYEEDCARLSEELIEIEQLRGKITELSVTIGSKDSELNSANSELSRLNEYINNKEQELADKDEEIKKFKTKSSNEKSKDKSKNDAEAQSEEINKLKESLNKEKRKVFELEAQLNAGESIIKTYSAVPTQTLKVCKPKSIIYFKEISSVRYCPSMIDVMLNIIRKARKLKCKLLIYDNRHSFMEVYKPITIVDSTKYMNDKETVVNQLDDIVIVEPNRAIIEDILTANYDVVIIYDRLHQINDIVTGNNVHKFWVINSRKDIEAMQRKLPSFKVSDVITREGSVKDALTIRTIGTKNNDASEYRDMTPSARSQTYYSMKSIQGGSGKGLIEELLIRTHVADIVTSVR